MSENPLLPHSKLRELHALMLRCRSLERKQRSGREALLAATSIQLLPGDLLSAPAGDVAAGQLAPTAKRPGHRQRGRRRGARCFGCRCARPRREACRHRAPTGIVLAFARAGDAEPGWTGALEWAQAAQLPLILACADATNGARARSGKQRQPALDFVSMSRLAKRLKLPVLTVDGEDAVAVYRVMQESVLRTRMGGGPAVLWAVMTPARSIAKLPRSSQPIARLRSYLSARKISLKP